MVLQGFLGALIQLLGIGAGGTLFLSSSPMIPALVLNSFLTNPGDDISLWSYAIGLVTPLVTGTVLLLSVLDVFVPLVSSLTNLHCYIGALNVRLQAGRIGEEAPARVVPPALAERVPGRDDRRVLRASPIFLLRDGTEWRVGGASTSGPE